MIRRYRYPLLLLAAVGFLALLWAAIAVTRQVIMFDNLGQLPEMATISSAKAPARGVAVYYRGPHQARVEAIGTIESADELLRQFPSIEGHGETGVADAFDIKEVWPADVDTAGVPIPVFESSDLVWVGGIPIGKKTAGFRCVYSPSQKQFYLRYLWTY